MSHEYHIPPKIAMINDLAGFGRCSTTAALPVISSMQVQVCPALTSLFSNHTGFPIHYMQDLTDSMGPYLRKWEELQLHFDGIYCGFLGSIRQARITAAFLKQQRQKPSGPVIIIDPVMGDHGKAYRTVDAQLGNELEKLISLAHIITPNITEACLLTHTAYRESGWTADDLSGLAVSLHAMGPDSIAVTGLREGTDFINYISVRDASGNIRSGFCRMSAAGDSRPGTGDIFASIIAANAVKGVDFHTSVMQAASFVRECTALSSKLHMPVQEGVCFENLLHLLLPQPPHEINVP